MRTLTAVALVAVLTLGTPALVQAQGASSGAPSQKDKAPAESSVTIRSIEVIDVKDLPPAVKSQIDDVIAKTTEDDMKSLRRSIDGTPAATSALRAKGLTSSQVVAINIADGVLTLFARTA